MFLKLAKGNMKKEKMIYLPFMISTTMVVAINMIILLITLDPQMDAIGYLIGSDAALAFMIMGSVLFALFSLFFLTYAQSFLTKKRQTTYGLYHVLGMSKWDLKQMLRTEVIMLYVRAVPLGIVIGILFARVIHTSFISLLTDIPFSLQINPFAIVGVLIGFILLFLRLYAKEAKWIRKSTSLSMLKAESAGETEPKIQVFKTFVGLVLLGLGYLISLLGNQLGEPAVGMMWSIPLTAVGTYFLFVYGSVTVMKLKRANKEKYYQPKHFIAISSMLFRLKQNGAGLASNTILTATTLIILIFPIAMFVSNIDEIRDFRENFEPGVVLEATADNPVVTGGDFIALMIFLGILFGISLVLATSMAIYYKQIGEGMADKKRFETLQKLGMNGNALKDTVSSQATMVFFLPVIIGIIHAFMALPMIYGVASAYFIEIGFVPILMTFVLVSLGVSALYFGVFKVTSRIYYRMIERT